jgi:hypothetical protein
MWLVTFGFVGIVLFMERSSSLMRRFRHFTDRIKTELSSFRSFRVVHVRQEANSIAHGLAREVVCHVIDSIWLEEIPPFIWKLLFPLF